MRHAVWLVLAATTLATADKARTPSEEIAAQLAGYHAAGSGDDAPAIAFSGHGVSIGEFGERYSGGSFGEIYQPTGKPTVAFAAGNTVAWAALDSRELISCVYPENVSKDAQGDMFACPKDKKKIIDIDGEPHSVNDVRHVTGLFEKTKKGWRPLAYHVGVPITGKDQAAELKKPIKLPAIKRVTGGADELVAVFEKSIASTKTLAKTVSDRADVVLYGSELAERYVGGATVKKQLEAWNLAVTVEGLHAGLASSKKVGFVAANVTATVGGKGKPSPYRVLAIYEKTDSWKLVQLHFSFPWITN